MINALAARDTFEDIRVLVLAVRRREHGYVAAHGFLGRVAKNPLGAPIPAPDDALQVFTDDAVVRGLDNRRQPLLRFLGLPSFGNILDGQKDRSPGGQRKLYCPRAEQHCPAPDAFKFMGNFEILEPPGLRQNIFQRPPQFRDVPLSVAEVIHETILALFFSNLEGLIERQIRVLNSQVAGQDQQRLRHGLNDGFGKVAGTPDRIDIE